MSDLSAVDRRVLLLLSDTASRGDDPPFGEVKKEVPVGRAIALVGLRPDVGAWVLEGHAALVEGEGVAEVADVRVGGGEGQAAGEEAD